jgi:hypothetical protein
MPSLDTCMNLRQFCAQSIIVSISCADAKRPFPFGGFGSTLPIGHRSPIGRGGGADRS